MSIETNAKSFTSRLMNHGDIFVVLALIFIVVMMVIPMPTFLLDLLLACNISFAVLILLLTMNILEPLELSIFPSLLLMTTLFRLALNVSSTRLILLQGYAGRVILAFGSFVVGGNYVVGMVVFLILVVIQFVVITRGAERVAEVAARFTLDAMPGKQMSIDADLNAGLISEDDARRRRLEVAREADFYGAMDGASKFVKGDAIAGIIITLINIIGGIIIGTLQQGLPVVEALQKYALLTVGDGLVSQIPALLISTATGIVVTRVSSEKNLGTDIIEQLLSQPKVLWMASALLLFIGIIPGMPTIPFIVLSGIVSFIAWNLQLAFKGQELQKREESVKREEEDAKKPESMLNIIQLDPMEVEVGYNLVPLVEEDKGGILDRLSLIRRQIAVDLGFILPLIRIRDNLQLRPGEYVIKLKGVQVGSGELMVGYYLAIESDLVKEKVKGISTTDPAFGLPALWVTEENKDTAEESGYTVVDPSSVLITHLSEVIKRYAHELLGRREVEKLMDNLRKDYGTLIDEIVPNLLSMGQVQRVLQNLLREGISIRDMVTILETLSEFASETKELDLLTEYVRAALQRQITSHYQSEDGVLRVITLNPTLEDKLISALRESDGNNYLNMDPGAIDRLRRNVMTALEPLVSQGYSPILLCASPIRPYLKRLLEGVLPQLAVLSYAEISPGVEVEALAVVKE